MVNNLVQWFIGTLGGVVSKEAVVFIISMFPILELRGGLIASVFYKIDIIQAVLICVVGNLLPVPLILWFITPIFSWLKRRKLFKPMVDKLEAKALKKRDQVEKYEFWGLALFVGIPLPGTGAWTGALIASLIGMRFKKALPAIFVGIVIATVIMSVVSYGIIGVFL